MKILLVDLKFDYGQEKRGLNQIGEVGFNQVFRSLGHEVTNFYYDSYLNRTEELQAELLKRAGEVKPDLIFFILFTNQFKTETLDLLKQKYRTINWFGDDQWRFDNFTSKYAPHFTHCITTDIYSQKKYNDIGVKNLFISQWAALNADIKDDVTAYKYDVSFIGGAHPVRKWMLNEFKKAGLNVTAFGHGWPQGILSIEEMKNVFQSSKINLNLSNSINYDIRFLTHHWKNIAYVLKGAKNNSQIKARNFEIPFFGGFQVSDYVPGLERYLDIGSEVVCYSNIDEAIQLTQYYLRNDAEREAIKKKSIMKARSHHTYKHRLKEILEQL